MDFLKELFGEGQSLTYDQLSEAVKGKGFQVVNAAGGAYVPKSQHDTIATQLSEANKKLEGYDPTWKEQAESARKKLEEQQFNFALERSVAGAKPRNAKAVMALLDREKLTFAGGEIVGLEKQLDALRKGEDTAFLFEEVKPTRTSINHQGGQEVGSGDDKKDAANNAFRVLLGRKD